MITIPRTMSTQHPDNVRKPVFASKDVLAGEEEITETFWSFSQYGCQEQMWDYEGKEVDPLVVPKLFSRHKKFFSENRLGEKFFLTFRIPNPSVEAHEARLLPEILSSIPRAYFTAQSFYNKNITPVFEVILPMATSAKDASRIFYYYKNFVAGQDNLPVSKGDIKISDWLGEFYPKSINVIPLFENIDSLLSADKMIGEYLKGKKLEYQRVFLARSDPALNYGSLAAVFMLNISLQRLHHLEKKIKIPIFPILGAGSSPFRGNLKPTNVESMLSGYASCQTFTVQSAFKYDWPEDIVKGAINKINNSERTDPSTTDEERALYLAQKTMQAYQKQIPEIATLVNLLAPFLPKRRLRKLHIGLFGYSRSIEGVKLPRAIGFCAALYSIGLPPELLGLHALDENDLKLVREIYPSPYFEEDLRDALAFYNQDVLPLLSSELKNQIQKAIKITDFQINEEHRKITSEIIHSLSVFQKKESPHLQHLVREHIQQLVVEAGLIRRFLG